MPLLKQHQALSILGFALTLGLLEASRSGFFWAYLVYSHQEAGLSPVIIGTAWTIHALTDTFSRSLGGYLVQRLGLPLFMAGASAAGWIALWLAAHHPGVWTLWGSSLVWGLTFSALWPGLMTMASRIAPQGREGRTLAFTGLLVLPFSGVGTLLTAFLAQRNLDLAYNGLTSFLATSALMSLVLVRYREPILPRKGELYPWRKLLVFLPAAFGQTFAPAMVAPLLIKFADEELGLKVPELAKVIGVGGVVALMGIAWLGRIADRRGPKLPLILGMTFLGAALVWLGQKPSLTEVFLLAVLVGVGFALFLPSWNALVVRLLPEQNRAAVWGTLMMVEGLGSATGPAVGGLIWSLYGPIPVFYSAAAIFILLAVFYSVTLRREAWK
ncbi:MFS transporter [Thermus filiformis]|uniref:Major facilitator superfamily (MFS) profile domain-containing protein n=1 Tax=Thermus filiformis TaxID=276 RepID=A0A0D6X9V4_THEFI|nr:MFS transporter [Thermus filiformis]KIX84520.1 hypothetical protein THFILI_07035 [Thermus filiformis]